MDSDADEMYQLPLANKMNKVDDLHTEIGGVSNLHIDYLA